MRRHDSQLLFWVLELHVLEHPACPALVLARAGMCLCPLGATVPQVAWSVWVIAPVDDCIQVLLADATGHRGLRGSQKDTAEGSETKIDKQYTVLPECAVLGPGILHPKWPSEYRGFQVWSWEAGALPCRSGAL